MTKDDYIELSQPSLLDVIRAAEDLCADLGVSYNPRNILVTTDYGTRVVVAYQKEEVVDP